MIPHVEKDKGTVKAKENDLLISKVGKFLQETIRDELLQLISILKRDISFVSPRVFRAVEIEVRDTKI
jgi:lipopolysaccharide/colanic/teichoic acid biosynthesis glycosyltransferase